MLSSKKASFHDLVSGIEGESEIVVERGVGRDGDIAIEVLNEHIAVTVDRLGEDVHLDDLTHSMLDL